MTSFSRRTHKLYYLDSFLSHTRARISKVGSDYIELDATIAYPEGGGQESDVGTLVLPDGNTARFVHVRKVYGQRANLTDFPDIQIGGVVEHVIHPMDVEHLKNLKTGEEVQISIDAMRRAQLSLSHTASHLLYMGVAKIRPDAVAWTLGCHIRPDGARFDFSVDKRISPDEVKAIEEIANGFVARGCEVRTYAHPDHLDARYWQCESNTMPCGGTHIRNTSPIGRMVVRRKSMGSGKERLSCQFDEARFDVSSYHSGLPDGVLPRATP